MNASLDLLYIHPNNLPIYSNLLTCDIISKAIERYKPIFFPPTFDLQHPPTNTEKILKNVTMNVRANGQCENHIELDSNEACK